MGGPDAGQIAVGTTTCIVVPNQSNRNEKHSPAYGQWAPTSFQAQAIAPYSINHLLIENPQNTFVAVLSPPCDAMITKPLADQESGYKAFACLDLQLKWVRFAKNCGPPNATIQALPFFHLSAEPIA
jgi:hypothetical protein